MVPKLLRKTVLDYKTEKSLGEDSYISDNVYIIYNYKLSKVGAVKKREVKDQLSGRKLSKAQSS